MVFKFEKHRYKQGILFSKNNYLAVLYLNIYVKIKTMKIEHDKKQAELIQPPFSISYISDDLREYNFCQLLKFDVYYDSNW